MSIPTGKSEGQGRGTVTCLWTSACGYQVKSVLWSSVRWILWNRYRRRCRKTLGHQRIRRFSGYRAALPILAFRLRCILQLQILRLRIRLYADLKYSILNNNKNVHRSWCPRVDLYLRIVKSFVLCVSLNTSAFARRIIVYQNIYSLRL